MFRSSSVTSVAISTITCRAGSSPVISRSIHTNTCARLRNALPSPAMAEPVPPAKPAATVLLLRDADTDDGIEVFMLRRTTAPRSPAACTCSPAARSTTADGEGDEGYVIAAIRECYEEAGVLLAHDANGAMSRTAIRRSAHRQAVYDGSVDLRAAVRSSTSSPLLSTTSCGSAIGSRRSARSPRRFDTRFFIAVAPPEQASTHDDNETIASAWVGPREALRRQADGETDDDAADDQEPRVRRRPSRRRSGDGVSRASSAGRPRSCRGCAGTPTAR